MTQEEFIGLVNGKPWANRACSFEQMDCWALVVLYYRHVLGLELHHIAGYESGAEFITCYEQEHAHWRRVPVATTGCIAVFYRGDSPLALLKVYSKVEYMVHGSI